MRAFLLFAAVVTTGCAGSRDSQRPGRSTGIPIVKETPSLSERMSVNRRPATPPVSQSMTEVSGNLMR
jgi:hypothetical protein